MFRNDDKYLEIRAQSLSTASAACFLFFLIAAVIWIWVYSNTFAGQKLALQEYFRISCGAIMYLMPPIGLILSICAVIWNRGLQKLSGVALAIVHIAAGLLMLALARRWIGF